MQVVFWFPALVFHSIIPALKCRLSGVAHLCCYTIVHQKKQCCYHLNSLMEVALRIQSSPVYREGYDFSVLFMT